MSDRMKLLEAVAEAARDYVDTAVANNSNVFSAGWGAMYRALRALDTIPLPEPLPAQPQPLGETVTLAVWQGPHGNAVLAVPGTVADRDDDRPWTRLGTVTLSITREGGR